MQKSELKKTAIQEPEGTLRRTLGLFDLIFLGLGAIIGAGIFVITGQAAALYAGPGIVLSFLLAAVISLLTGLCYAELCAVIPLAGSAYAYAYRALGRLAGMLTGWSLIAGYLSTGALVAVGWSGYMVNFLKDFGIAIPPWLTTSPLAFEGGPHWSGALVNLPAVLIIVLLASVSLAGMQGTARVNRLIVFIKIAAIMLFVGFGVMFVCPGRWTPFVPPNTGEFGHFGWSGVLRGTAVVLFAYLGFDIVAAVAQETPNPQRNVPLGILVSISVSAILYVIVALVLTGLVPYGELNIPAPMALALDSTGPALTWLRPVIKIGALAGLSSVVLAYIMALARIVFAMSCDGLLPGALGLIHPRFCSPHIATVLAGAAAALLAGIFPLSSLGELASLSFLLVFATACLSVVVLRCTEPDLPRPFKVPLYPLVPVLGIVISVIALTGLPGAAWVLFLVWITLGVLFYCCKRR